MTSAILDAGRSDAELRATVETLFKQARDDLTAHIITGQQQGKVRADIAAGPAAAWIIGMLEGGMPRLVGTATDADLPAFRDALAAILWHALYCGVDNVHS